MSAPHPTVVKFFDSAGSPTHREAATQLHGIFEQLAYEFGNAGNPTAAALQFGSIDCAQHRNVCDDRKVERGSVPVVKFWTGETFRRCSLPLRLQPPPREPRLWREPRRREPPPPRREPPPREPRAA